MSKYIDFDLNLSQPQVDIFVSEAKSVAAVAGFGSGKTEAAMIKMISTMLEFPRANMLYLAPTFPLIRDIWYPKIEEFLTNIGVKFFINKSEHIIQLYGYGRIFCRTMEHPGRIIGFEVLDAFLDELDVLSTDKALEVFRKAKARCRQKIKGKKSQMYVTTTPEGFKATYLLFKKEPLENSQLVQMSTYSNEPNLPDDYIAELYSIYPAQLIDAYIMGKFVNLTAGTVYTSFDRDLNNAPGIVPFPFEPLHFGMDFNVQNMSAIPHVIRKGKPIAVGEIVGLLDTPNMIKAIENKYPDHPKYVWPDASGKNRQTQNASLSDLKLLKNAGLKVKVRNKNPFIKDRILSMNSMFCNANEERSYLVNVDAAPTYTENLEQQVYNDAGLPDKTSNMDHTNDAGGYFIEGRFGINKPSSQGKRLIT